MSYGIAERAGMTESEFKADMDAYYAQLASANSKKEIAHRVTFQGA